MARPSEHVTWAGGEHSFRLGIGELRAIEQRCNAGVFVVMMRLMGGQHGIDDVLQPLRLGLIGGGMPEKDAKELIDRVLDDCSPYALTIAAADVLRRFIMWEGEDAPGE